MPRTLSTAVAAAVASGAVSLAIFVVDVFADDTVYAYTGIGPLTPAGPASNPLSTFPYGQTFTGLGWLLKLSNIPQTQKVQAQNITQSLNGAVAALVQEIVNQVRITGTATIYLGFFDDTGALIKDPVQIFSGGLDVPTLTDDGNSCVAGITCENPLLRLNQAPNRRLDDADQQIYYPGDLGFFATELLQTQQLFWPAPQNSGSPYPVQMTVTPNGAAIAVGGTQQMTVTMTYSDSSTYSIPGGGGGPSFVADMATTNPAIATVDLNGVVTGVAEGECSVMVRIVYFTSGGGGPAPSGQYRAAAGILVHA